MNPLRELRLAKGLTLPQMAQSLGIPYTTLSGMELGYPGSISPRVMQALAGVGYDGEALQRRYIEWRAETGREATASTLNASV